MALMAATAIPPAAHGQADPPLYALGADNSLMRLSSSNPSNAQGKMAISGLQSGESIVGIDVRPANGQLYGVGSTGRLYTINPQTGAASQSGSATLNPALSGSVFGVDWNPVPDRLRVVTDNEQNLRINVETVEVTNDGALKYAPTDANAAANPNVVAAGYTNSMAGATATTLYVIDAGLDILATQNPPNDGVLNTVGPLGVQTGAMTAFDIAPGSNTAYAALTSDNGTSSSLYTIDLTTGRASSIGAIGGGQPIRGLAIAAMPATAPASAAPAPAATAPTAMPMPAQLPRTGQAESWLVGLTLLTGTVLLSVGFAARRRRA